VRKPLHNARMPATKRTACAKKITTANESRKDMAQNGEEDGAEGMQTLNSRRGNGTALLGEGRGEQFSPKGKKTFERALKKKAPCELYRLNNIVGKLPIFGSRVTARPLEIRKG